MTLIPPSFPSPTKTMGILSEEYKSACVDHPQYFSVDDLFSGDDDEGLSTPPAVSMIVILLNSSSLLFLLVLARYDSSVV